MRKVPVGIMDDGAPYTMLWAAVLAQPEGAIQQRGADYEEMKRTAPLVSRFENFKYQDDDEDLHILLEESI
jgi:hypothetical protein